MAQAMSGAWHSHPKAVAQTEVGLDGSTVLEALVPLKKGVIGDTDDQEGWRGREPR